MISRESGNFVLPEDVLWLSGTDARCKFVMGYKKIVTGNENNTMLDIKRERWKKT